MLAKSHQQSRLQSKVRARLSLPLFEAASLSDQTLSSRRFSASMAFNDANRNVAENVPRLTLFAMLASVSFRPCSL